MWPRRSGQGSEVGGVGWRQLMMDFEGNVWKMDFILSAKGSL